MFAVQRFELFDVKEIITDTTDLHYEAPYI